MLEFRNVSKHYEGGEAPALRNINLTVQDGEFVYVTGPSGAGKSTLLRLAYLEERPSDGVVWFQGRPISACRPRHRPEIRRHIGIIFQDFRLIPHQSVYENIALPLRILGVPERQLKNRVTELIELVDLAARPLAAASALSGGEQQRVAIARALAPRPRLILADEPTGNLDAARSHDTLRLLEFAHAQGASVLVATHDEALLRSRQHRRITLHHGAIVQPRTAHPYDEAGASHRMPKQLDPAFG